MTREESCVAAVPTHLAQKCLASPRASLASRAWPHTNADARRLTPNLKLTFHPWCAHRHFHDGSFCFGLQTGIILVLHHTGTDREPPGQRRKRRSRMSGDSCHQDIAALQATRCVVFSLSVTASRRQTPTAPNPNGLFQALVTSAAFACVAGSQSIIPFALAVVRALAPRRRTSPSIPRNAPCVKEKEPWVKTDLGCSTMPPCLGEMCIRLLWACGESM